jgi:hypothetical protein
MEGRSRAVLEGRAGSTDGQTDMEGTGGPSSARPAARREEGGKLRGGLGTVRGFGERASGSAASLGARAGGPDTKVACARAGAAPALAARRDVVFQRDALRCRLV